MSSTEVHKGKLVPMVLNGWTPEERAKDACEKLGIPFDDDYDTWLEVLNEYGYRKVLIRNDVTYKIEDVELDPYGFSEITKNIDGSYDYFISYYNGGGSFDEVIEGALDGMDKND